MVSRSFFWWNLITINSFQIANFYFFFKSFALFLTNKNVKVLIFMRFCTFLVLLPKEFFYTFPSQGTFSLKVCTLNIFSTFFKNYFSNYTILLKENHKQDKKNKRLFLQTPLNQLKPKYRKYKNCDHDHNKLDYRNRHNCKWDCLRMHSLFVIDQ